jgi:ketosteroid isomerase-like protein
MFAQAPDSPSEAEIRAVIAEGRKANVEGDAAKVVTLLADEYLQTDIYGYVQDKTAWLTEYFQPLAKLIKAGTFRWEIFEVRDVKIRVYGDSAVVIGSLTAKGTGARADRDHHSWVADPNASFSGTLRFTRVYIKRDGKWLLVALHNAVPVPPPRAAE